MKDDGTIQPAKITHFTQQGFTIKGVIHCGGNDGEEVYSYRDLGIEHILEFEPLPQAVAKARHDHPGLDVEQLALSDYNGESEFIVTVGDGKGSSLLEPIIDHEEVIRNWRDNAMIAGTEIVKVERLDHYFKRSTHIISDYDCLVIDSQGTEWEVLHGCGKLLKQFKYLSVELSIDPVYRGEHPGQEVIDWLVGQGFTQDSEIQSHNDVFMIRSDIKPTSDLVYRGLS